MDNPRTRCRSALGGIPCEQFDIPPLTKGSPGISSPPQMAANQAQGLALKSHHGAKAE